MWGLGFLSKHAPFPKISQPSDMTKRTTQDGIKFKLKLEVGEVRVGGIEVWQPVGHLTRCKVSYSKSSIE